MSDDDIRWDLRLGPELSHEEIAIILGISRQWVSTLEKRALAKLRRQMGSTATGTVFELTRTRRTKREPNGNRGAFGRAAKRDGQGRFLPKD